MTIETVYEHVVVDSDGVARIEGTRIRVIDLALDKLAYGWSPEEMHFQYPHLTMGQIYAALSYYSDHQDELDAEIESRLEKADRFRAEARANSLARRLRERDVL